MRTFAYQVYLPAEYRWTWYPINTVINGAFRVTYGLSALDTAPIPDSTMSYYVPEAKAPNGALLQGPSAVANFYGCPNNDGGSFLNNARIRIVVKDALDNGIPGIPAADIFVLFNGGTSVQGFVGDGADSIIANSTYNSGAACPDLKALYADGPTDAAGQTYITFTGSQPGNPGVAVRDPSRKWGHFDSDLPVFVLGQRIGGRITEASDPGSYSLRLKSRDIVLGLSTVENVGEVITGADVSQIVAHNGHTVGADTWDYWLDLDSSGSVTGIDVTNVSGHIGHHCSYGLNP